MTKISKTKHGLMVYLPNDMWIGQAFDWYGEAMEHEVELLCRLLKPDGVFLDAGAHFGAITIPLAKEASKVYAFEPQSRLYNMLTTNVSLNALSNVECFRAGLGNSNDTMYLDDIDYSVEANFGDTQLKKDSAKPVTMKTIDEMNLSQLDLIKIDVEGMSVEVLEGAAETISRCMPNMYIEAMPGDPVPVAKKIESFGYQCKLFEPPYYNANNFASNSTNRFEGLISCDFVCVPNGDVMPDSQFFVDIEASNEPRHAMLKGQLN